MFDRGRDSKAQGPADRSRSLLEDGQELNGKLVAPPGPHPGRGAQRRVDASSSSSRLAASARSSPSRPCTVSHRRTCRRRPNFGQGPREGGNFDPLRHPGHRPRARRRAMCARPISGWPRSIIPTAMRRPSFRRRCATIWRSWSAASMPPTTPCRRRLQQEGRQAGAGLHQGGPRGVRCHQRGVVVLTPPRRAPWHRPGRQGRRRCRALGERREELVLLVAVHIDRNTRRRVDLHRLLRRGNGGGQIVDRCRIVDLARSGTAARAAFRPGLLQPAQDLLLLPGVDAPVGGGRGDHGADVAAWPIRG